MPLNDETFITHEKIKLRGLIIFGKNGPTTYVGDKNMYWFTKLDDNYDYYDSHYAIKDQQLIESMKTTISATANFPGGDVSRIYYHELKSSDLINYTLLQSGELAGLSVDMSTEMFKKIVVAKHGFRYYEDVAIIGICAAAASMTALLLYWINKK